ncbi:beta-galactosidase/beta-glucuronidase-like protein [Catenovulum agarivorans DS-2]|uniref:Beta-galactosidase/beta-glucuronidase-like protein n=1 Tax=Catenovulum agarivorans DS-2 TaxID=1328313 RepID=W7Q6K7_9ALTE|nr:glycoside hydrolase family 2 TIM barrel-domain containing protein [Catenovulum agarivorans]EWH08409.1 beta-galactosidase/beta-glucuronidase-like protein [Catenovulum agarivorans DS-2]
MKFTRFIRLKAAQTAAAIGLALFSAITIHTQAAQPLHTSAGQQLLINHDWQYLENNTENAKLALKQTDWQVVDLPHSWNVHDSIDAIPGYRRSASWYKRNLVVNQEQAANTIIYFEGANFETDLYVNGQHVGQHVGGYLGFEFNISKYLTDGDNQLLVRVSNAYNPNLIPSQKADFFLHGGITRDVWIKHLPTTYIDDVQIDIPQVSKASATTQVKIELNQVSQRQALQVQLKLLDPNKQIVQQQTVQVKQKQLVEIALAPVIEPMLWSPDAPNLYQVQVDLLDEGKRVHSQTEVIGYRWFEMRPHQGFFVNGEPVLIRGTHRHEEHSGFGAALPNEQHRKDMQMIKEMGANFVRLAHYPQDPEVYKAANELGLILWDELPWCRGGKGGVEWEQNTERLLRQQIKQNRNHPSIAFWSLGNEIYWEEDFPGGGREEIVLPYLTKLNQLVKALDPTRMTTIRKYYPGAHVVDAFSPSIWAGWYGGAYGQYEVAIKDSMKKYPAFLHMEYGGSSHVGRHVENPISKDGILDAQVSVEEAMNQAVVKSVAKDSDWNESYMVDLFDWHLKVSESTAGFAGNAQWAFKDFGTPLRPLNPIPYMNQKGLVDASGKPKDAYYVFKSYWAKEPFCYIESKTWTHRNGPKEGRPVSVYCNTESAELWLNGESLGKITKDPTKFPAGGLVWQTPFKSGINKLEVKGYSKGKTVAKDELQVTYVVGKHGKYDHIKLTQTKLENGNVLITAEARDADGNRVIDYSEKAHFSSMEGNGYLYENYGVPGRTNGIQMANGVASIEFKPGDKPATIEFRTQNIKGVYTVVQPL